MGEIAPITYKVVTPERVLIDGPADSVVVPAFDGELAVLQDHAPLITTLGLGEVRARYGEDLTRLAVNGGFAQVRDNVVTILASQARRQDEIDRDDVEAEVERLRTNRPHDLSAREQWQELLDWQILLLRLSRPASAEH
jgi:F-type H+-transporting ATPase subunit epsilon